MAWYDEDSWATKAFGANLPAFLVTLAVAFGLPLLLHLYLYRQRVPAKPPTFLLIGPSGAGKTKLLTSLETGTPSQTHTSQTPASATLTLSPSITAFSARFRAAADPSKDQTRRLLITDYPGHGKLRHQAFTALTSALKDKSSNLRGVIFLVDAAALAGPQGLADAAEFLHDVLLALQQRHDAAKSSQGPKACPVLVGANKGDLFTALPAQLVRRNLEQEITRVRQARAKGIVDVDSGEEGENEGDWLGDGGEGAFSFKQMEEVNVVVEVVEGSVEGENGPGVMGWWEWIGGQM
ncbi:P-loop containing nucleoside triphosphate hydrolase protein [Saccharata proteae CBS 121410]|uniref:Signal recognition particle receptor subunit beta n=1 Tax=Saccharata proteae CBS 121410 TaxID=1314787 RepID=A0A9P4M0I3_9PEZI|nr:P-loop containing nucleoside triphosphate hydrolase protein [Saccharata proteae CBS 121410]